MDIDNVKIIPVAENRIYISWKFKQTLENFQEYIFILERSEDPASGYIPVFEFNHNIEYTDSVWFKKIWRNLYYRFQIVHTPSGTVNYTKAYRMSVAPDLEALEIVRRNNIMLRNRRYGTGTPIAVFKQKTVGPKCPVCWDYNKQKIRSSTCDECFKTGIEGGYYDPIITWANLTPPQKMVQIPQWGEMEPNEIRIFLSNEPVVNPKDIFFAPNDMLFYQINQIEISSRRGYLLHQLAAASVLDRSSIIYKLLNKYPQLTEQLDTEREKIKLR